MFQWWIGRYLNCQALHSSVSCVYDTSCLFVSYNAHRFRCGMLTQAGKCLLTPIYRTWWNQLCIEVCTGWGIIKTNKSATASCKAERSFVSPSLFKCRQPFTIFQPAALNLPLFSFQKANLSSYLSHAAMCLPLRKWRFLHILVRLIRLQSKTRARRWITCGLDIVPQNVYTICWAEISPLVWMWAFWQCLLTS